MSMLFLILMKLLGNFMFPGFEWLAIGLILTCTLLYFKIAFHLNRLGATNDLSFWKTFYYIVVGSGLLSCILIAVILLVVGGLT